VAQFTVHRNKNPRSKSSYPLLVDVQSALLEPPHTRVVVPLTRVAGLTRKPVSHLTPTVRFEGDTYVLMTPLLAGVARADLGAATGTIAEERLTIMAAMDFLLSGC
jgi:toxin CcdB